MLVRNLSKQFFIDQTISTIARLLNRRSCLIKVPIFSIFRPVVDVEGIPGSGSSSNSSRSPLNRLNHSQSWQRANVYCHKLIPTNMGFFSGLSKFYPDFKFSRSSFNILSIFPTDSKYTIWQPFYQLNDRQAIHGRNGGGMSRNSTIWHLACAPALFFRYTIRLFFPRPRIFQDNVSYEK